MSIRSCVKYPGVSWDTKNSVFSMIITMVACTVQLFVDFVTGASYLSVCFEVSQTISHLLSHVYVCECVFMCINVYLCFAFMCVQYCVFVCLLFVCLLFVCLFVCLCVFVFITCVFVCLFLCVCLSLCVQVNVRLNCAVVIFFVCF